MVRLDLAFFLCCCRACLGGNHSEEESFYDLLGVERDASIEEIKKAYRKKSLSLHPDKLAQKGKVVTEEDQERFTRVKEAYETLSDEHKRETYDTIGEKGMKWVEDPMSIDPQEMADNFANSSTLDRSKIFAIFLSIAIAVFILPILICLQVDGKFGANAKWAAVATPLWIWNACILFYHIRIIMMGPIQRPDHIPEEDWMDPLPMSGRLLGLFRFVLIFSFQLLAVLKLDGRIAFNWSLIFVPILIQEAMTFWRRVKQSKREVITVEEMETIVGKAFSEMTEEEKEAIHAKYDVVPSKSSPKYQIFKGIQESAKTDLIRITFRAMFIILLLVQLDTGVGWSWWIVFTPFFAMSCCICCNRCQKYAEAQAEFAEKLGGEHKSSTEHSTDYGAMEEGQNTEIPPNESLTQEQRDEMKGKVFQAGSRACTTCCSQVFFLVLLCLFLGKIQGAAYSSFWIISPFLFIASIILCLLGCTIFCVAPFDEEEMTAAYQNMDGNIFTPPADPIADPEQPPIVVPENKTSDVTAATNSEEEIAKTKAPDKQVVAATEPVQAVAVETIPAEAVTVVPAATQVVDLLDDNNNVINNANPNKSKPEEVAPTKSDIDDLD
jgi:hypothetical protein